MSPEPISLLPNLGVARIAVWVALGSASWAVLVAVVMLVLRLVA